MGERQNVKALMVKDITADPGIQPRAKGLTDDVVEEYAAAMTDGREFPPVVVYRDPATGTHWLAQGFHRLAAAVKAGRKKIAAEVRPGTRRDALIDAAGSNALHGLRRTNPDKRRAVELLIRECSDWSNRRIADAAGVGDDLVADVRKTVRKDGNQLSESDSSQSSEDKTTGSDGKARGPKHEAPKAAAGGQVATGSAAGGSTPDGGSESSGGGAADAVGGGSAGGGSAEPSGDTAGGTSGGGGGSGPGGSDVIPPVTRDAWGIPVQPHASAAFAAVPKFKELIQAIRHAAKLFNEVANLPGGQFLTLPEVSSYRRGKKLEDGTYADRFVHPGLETADRQVANAIPTYTVCPYQYAEVPHQDDCRCCRSLGWTPPLGPSIPPECVDRAKAAFGVTGTEG